MGIEGYMIGNSHKMYANSVIPDRYMKILDDVDPPNLFQLYDSLLKVKRGNPDKICNFR